VNSHQRLPEAEWSIRISEEVKGWSSLAKIGSASAQPQSEWAKGIRCLCWSSNLDWVGSPRQWHNRKSMKKQVFDTRCSSYRRMQRVSMELERLSVFWRYGGVFCIRTNAAVRACICAI